MSADAPSTLHGWGRHAIRGSERRGENLESLTEGAVLSRGLGRSYGDSSLPPGDRPEAVNTTLADRILAFDPATGEMRAEAGLSLFELNRLFIHRGWFTPVSPGTQYVTLGGMVSADVHGKNQHVAGDFGHHVRSLKMRVADGSVVECDRHTHADLFRATIGGMGLLGHILEVSFTLDPIPSPWIHQESKRIDDIDQFQDELTAAAPRWPYTVGWFDCTAKGKHLGRGILMCGRWADPEDAPKRWPLRAPSPRLRFDWPDFMLGRTSIRAFNELFYWKHLRREQTSMVPYDSFWYPLDAIRDWYHMYGRRGFTQYQCVLPREAGRGSVRRLLEVFTSRGGVSFLSVIKDLGRSGEGILSFPRPGVTINLDIPVRDDTQALVDAMNELVIAEGGRIYLAKDSFTRVEHFRAMEPRLAEFEKVRDRWDPERRFRSAQSVRLFGDPGTPAPRPGGAIQ